MSDVLDNTENTEDQNQATTPVEDDTPATEPVEEEMVIELIVETGTCVDGANSYVSLEEATLYHSARNRTEWLALSDNEKKASLIKATQYVDATYNWKGREFRPLSQALAFPRVLVVYHGYEVKGIPMKLKEAVLEASFYGYEEELFTTRDNESAAVKRDKKRVEGAVESEVEYFNASEKSVDYISKYAALDSILKGLYIPKNSKSINARANWGY